MSLENNIIIFNQSIYLFFIFIIVFLFVTKKCKKNSAIKNDRYFFNNFKIVNDISSLLSNCSITKYKSNIIVNNKDYQKFMNSLSCSCKRIGYWGGFCLYPDKARKMFAGCDIHLAHYLGQLFINKRVVDLGGGLGWYCQIIGKNSKICDEYDGSVNVEEITNGKVKYLNLAEPINFDCNYDIAMSIEVAELIPVEYEDIYINNLLKCSKEAIVLSWSRVGQKGHFHVNNKNKKDVIKLFEKKGLKFDNKITNNIKNVTKFSWIRRNILYFKKQKTIDMI